MITGDGLGKEVIDALARTDVAKYGFSGLSPALPLIEGWTPEQVEIQDRLARIIFSSVLGALSNPKVVGGGSIVFANAIGNTVSLVLAENGWTDDGAKNKIEVKRSAG
ncbi:hypothetical protein [Rhodococcus phage REQ1]|uniref:hypothetical protein n=1 Tax=Rhodococcus phage REQ1 TaxID=1109712 RepID=UPI00023EEC05|nr:hypothetical protein RoPhREQ1_gp36 [Rhodococcus phage REQ1]AEV52032.1 hypothetical protein [Rhodococcus phage REQ1]